MKRLLTILTLFITLMPLSATGSDDLLSRCAAKIKSAPSLYVSYSVTADGHIANGQIVIQGDMFMISAPGMRSWYDGKTQWTYSSQIGEVNVITPTPEEVRQINPIAIINNFSSAYTSKILKSAAGMTDVRLTAKNKDADIKSVDVTIDDKSLYPTSMTLDMSNNQKVKLEIHSVNKGAKLPASDFRYDSKSLPGVNVVDLR